MALTRKQTAAAVTGLGTGLVSYGVSVIYWPAGVILLGLSLAAIGLFVINVDGD